ncbi:MULTISPECIES: hypothetical protein [Methylobacter]
MTSLTIDRSRQTKILAVILHAIPLFGCGISEEHLLGQLSTDPAIAKAEIVMTGSKGFLNLEYRKGGVWPDVHVEVDIKKMPSGYEITRLDEKTKLVFQQAEALSSIHVCSDCVSYYEGKMPLFWNLK